MATWNETSERFTHTTDKLGKAIDQGIFETVVALNMLNFCTTQSCEGHIDWGLAAPWIDVIPDGTQRLNKQIQRIRQQAPIDEPLPDEAKHLIESVNHKQKLLFQLLVKLLDQFYGQRHVAYDQQLFPRIGGGGRIRLGSIGIEMQTIVEEDVKAQKLLAYQREMKDFTTFMKSLLADVRK